MHLLGARGHSLRISCEEHCGLKNHMLCFHAFFSVTRGSRFQWVLRRPKAPFEILQTVRIYFSWGGASSCRIGRRHLTTVLSITRCGITSPNLTPVSQCQPNVASQQHAVKQSTTTALAPTVETYQDDDEQQRTRKNRNNEYCDTVSTQQPSSWSRLAARTGTRTTIRATSHEETAQLSYSELQVGYSELLVQTSTSLRKLVLVKIGSTYRNTNDDTSHEPRRNSPT